MKTLAAREAKYNFGRLIDTARAAPGVIEKHGRPVVVVMAVEEYERLKAIEAGQPVKSRHRRNRLGKRREVASGRPRNKKADL